MGVEKVIKYAKICTEITKTRAEANKLDYWARAILHFYMRSVVNGTVRRFFRESIRIKPKIQ